MESEAGPSRSKRPRNKTNCKQLDNTETEELLYEDDDSDEDFKFDEEESSSDDEDHCSQRPRRRAGGRARGRSAVRPAGVSGRRALYESDQRYALYGRGNQLTLIILNARRDRIQMRQFGRMERTCSVSRIYPISRREIRSIYLLPEASAGRRQGKRLAPFFKRTLPPPRPRAAAEGVGRERNYSDFSKPVNRQVNSP
ncbi:hypothetical protein EVAR_87898_1 [Eumeta japonica]|uniref:Uncharacterized protein n=1 Tax=Eumeta variegata TaxID=151549 RepID=A0A4C1WXS5_EUMVA|nr:hypothetical protein EVAR_87898_1 [Eumeta japonica]